MRFFSKDQSGSVLIEFALALPLLALLITFCVQVIGGQQSAAHLRRGTEEAAWLLARANAEGLSGAASADVAMGALAVTAAREPYGAVLSRYDVVPGNVLLGFRQTAGLGAAPTEQVSLSGGVLSLPGGVTPAPGDVVYVVETRQDHPNWTFYFAGMAPAQAFFVVVRRPDEWP